MLSLKRHNFQSCSCTYFVELNVHLFWKGLDFVYFNEDIYDHCHSKFAIIVSSAEMQHPVRGLLVEKATCDMTF